MAAVKCALFMCGEDVPAEASGPQRDEGLAQQEDDKRNRLHKKKRAEDLS